LVVGEYSLREARGGEDLTYAIIPDVSVEVPANNDTFICLRPLEERVPEVEEKCVSGADL
jgi:hypothetical protein